MSRSEFFIFILVWQLGSAAVARAERSASLAPYAGAKTTAAALSQANEALFLGSQKRLDDPDQKEITTNLEIQHVGELEEESARVWNLLLACNKGDAERSRQNYADAVFCPRNGAAAVAAKEVGELRNRLRAFLTTTHLSAHYAETHSLNETLLPHAVVRFHPLFIQMVMELISEPRVFPDVDWKAPGFSLFTPRAQVFAENLMRNEDEIGARLRHGALLRIVNGLMLLIYNSPEDCLSWGLWGDAAPALLRAIDVSANDSSWSLVLMGSKNSPDMNVSSAFYIMRSAGLIEEKIAKACSPLPKTNKAALFDEILDFSHKNSTAWWIQLIKIYREMGDQH